MRGFFRSGNRGQEELGIGNLIYFGSNLRVAATVIDLTFLVMMKSYSNRISTNSMKLLILENLRT